MRRHRLLLWFVAGLAAAVVAVAGRGSPMRPSFVGLEVIRADDPTHTATATQTTTPGPTSTAAPTDSAALPTAEHWHPPSGERAATLSPPTMCTPHMTPCATSTP